MYTRSVDGLLLAVNIYTALHLLKHRSAEPWNVGSSRRPRPKEDLLKATSRADRIQVHLDVA